MTVVLGALAAVLFGVGDFVAGFGGRRDDKVSSPATIALTASIVGAVLSFGYNALVAGDRLVGSDLGWSLAAGLVMSAARPLLYRGMARESIVVFAPVFALGALVVPALLGALVGQSLVPIEIVGVLLAIPAVVLVASDRRLPTMAELRGSSAVRQGSLVGSLVGLAGLFLSFVSEDAGVAPAIAITATGVVVIPLIGRLLGLPFAPNRTTTIFGVAVGLTSVTAFVLAALAYQRGSAAVGSALIGMSPGITIALAWKILGEKIWPVQLAGGALGVGAIVLFALA